MRRKLGQLLFEIVALSKDFKDPTGRRFSAVLVQELLMGRLADLLQRDKESTRVSMQKIIDLTALNGDLSKLNAQLTAQLTGQPGSVTTPNGYVFDAADLAAVDEKLAAESTDTGVPVPSPANPG